jgi:transaldolase / glucose-6-phosphate isomerase
MTIAQELFDQHGQSIWYDNIRRALIESGELQSLLDQGVRGITSNPSIFEKAISGSNDYDADMQKLVSEGKSANEIYEALVLEDIRRAADLLRPLYDDSDGVDGYISLEVSPHLSHDTDGTVHEGARFYAALKRPNVMIKVPATAEGIPAITTLISQGINVNVTLMFSQQQYVRVADAYIAGLEKLLESGGDISKVASVASFFISRLDSKIDPRLEENGGSDLMGRVAIANARLVYEIFKEKFSNARWKKLEEKGARRQRVLWASTSTKNPAYMDTMYVDALIGPDTVNTVPPKTLKSLQDHATVARTVDANMQDARVVIASLRDYFVDLDEATDELLVEGVEKFAQSFDSLMASIEQKRTQLTEGPARLALNLGDTQKALDKAIEQASKDNLITRIWEADHTVWAESPDEITNRLGWLHIAEEMQENITRMTELRTALLEAGYTNVLLLGMGGSSLAPEVFRETFGVHKEHGLELDVLDSTDPDYVNAYAKKLDLSKTAFIVATKSGGTAETLSFFKFFYNRTLAKVGAEHVGSHFIAITDPGSKLETLAKEHNFRATFLNDPNIGGRYSALSYFGLLPAALVGVDVHEILERAQKSAAACASCVEPEDNDGVLLGLAMGELAKAGRDKLTFITSKQLESFGDWVEQLVAESTGKNGKGILPVVGEDVGAPDIYGKDRVFVYMRLKDDDTHNDAVEALAKAGHPVMTVLLDDLYDLGAQFFLWEMATAVAGHSLGIHPFDQPNVESAKVRAREMIDAYTDKGKLPEQEAAIEDEGITVYGDTNSRKAHTALQAFVDELKEGDYVALQAYVHPTPETTEALQVLRLALREKKKVATTVGYGPRFLHSTGQLHKGDGGNGLFIQFTNEPKQDLPIPDTAGEEASAMTFGVLKLAQALGDAQALQDNKRRLMRFDLGKDVNAALKRLTESMS